MNQSGHDELTFKRYALAFFLIIALVLIAVVGANRLIDPYGLWQTPRVKNFNLKKTRRQDMDYLFKSRDLIYQHPKTVFIGSSRTAFSLSPDAPVLVQSDRLPVYNAALVGGNVKVIRHYLEHAIHNNPTLETVVIGVDFFTFNQSVEIPHTYHQNRLVRSSFLPVDLFDTLVSLHVLRDSWRTVIDNRSASARTPFTERGQLTTWKMQENVRRQGMQMRFTKSLRYLHSSSRFGQFAFSTDYWNELIKIKSLTTEHHIDLIVFVSPVHISLFEAVHYHGLWDDYQLWLRNLSTEFEFWDYSMPNQYNTEKLNDDARHYWDVSHYREHVGNAVLHDLFDPLSDSPLGRKVTSENIDRYLQELNDSFLEWRRNNADSVKFVENAAH